MKNLIERFFGNHDEQEGESARESTTAQNKRNDAEQESSPRGGEIIQHLNRIYELHQRFSESSEGKRRDESYGREFRFDTDNTKKGVSAAACVLGGVPAWVGSVSLRGTPMHPVGSALGLLGAQFASRGTMDLLDYYWGTPRRKFEAWQREKRGKKESSVPHDDEDELNERIPQRSLRVTMVRQQLEALAQHAVLRDNRRKYVEKKKQLPAIKSTLEFLHLQELSEVLVVIISRQRALLETMRYYKDLIEYQESKKNWKPLGIASAQEVLLGSAQGDPQFGEKVRALWESPQLHNLHNFFDGEALASQISTLVSFLFGFVIELNAFVSQQKDVDSLDDILDDLDREIRSLDSIRQDIERRLPQLGKKLGISYGEEEGGNDEGAEYERWQRDFHTVLAGVQEKYGKQGGVRVATAATETPLSSLDVLLGLSSARNAVAPSVASDVAPDSATPAIGEITPAVPVAFRPPDTPADYTPAPAFEVMNRLISRRTFKPFILGVLRKNTKGDPSAVTEDLTASSSLENVIQFQGDGQSMDAVDPTTAQSVAVVDPITGQSKQVIDPTTAQPLSDTAIRRDIQSLGDTCSTLKRNSPRETLHGFLGPDFIAALEAAKGDLESVQRNRALADGKKRILEHPPEKMRADLLREFHIADIPDVQAEKLDQIMFESLIAGWLGRQATSEEDKAAFTSRMTGLNTALLMLEDEKYPVPRYNEKKELIRGAARRITPKPEFSVPRPEQKALYMVAMREIRSEYLKEREVIFYGQEGKRDLRTRMESCQRDPFISPEKKLTGPYKNEINQIDYTHEGVMSDIVDHGTSAVPSGLIIGSSVDRASLILPDNKDAIFERAQKLANFSTHEVFHDHFYDHSKKDRERIVLWKFNGPEGPVYLIDEGADYVAAAKIAGLPRIVAKVREVRQGIKEGEIDYPLPIRLSNIAESDPRYQLLLELRRLRLLDGDFEMIDAGGTKKNIVIKITKLVLPWLPWFFSGLPGMCLVYERHYPKLFHNLRDVDGRAISPRAIELLTSEPEFYKKFLVPHGSRSRGDAG